MNTNTAEMAISTNNEMSLTSATNQTSYCSFTANSKAEKIKLFKAMSAADKKLSDCINSTIEVKDVFMEIVNMTNTETGEVTPTPRIVLFDKDGTSYSCVSFGIMNSLKRLFVVFGEPTWEDGLKMKVVQISNKDRKMLSLEIVG